MSSKKRPGNSRRSKRQRRKDRLQIILCVAGALGAVALSLGFSYVMFGGIAKPAETAAQVSSLPAFNASEPFSVSDLTARQLERIRQEGRIRVSDGPRGISVGDSLDKLLSVYPSTFSGSRRKEASASEQALDEATLSGMHLTSQVTSEQVGLRPDEEQILYCADYFENANGIMTALPPRGLLAANTGSIVVTLLSPTTAYPAGTQDNYRSFEHVYCVYTVEPDGMTVSAIELGLTD